MTFAGVSANSTALLQVLDTLAKHVQGLSTLVQGLDAKVTTQVQGLDAKVTTEVQGLSTQVQGLDAKVTTEVQGLSTQVQGLSTQVQGLDAKVTTEFSITRSLASIRETTSAAAENILSSVQNMEMFEKMFDHCAVDEIQECWLQIANFRENISSATNESHVQDIVAAVASRCCKNGPLAFHDTHKKHYPQQHKVDLCFTPSSFNLQEKVPMAMVAVFGEVKHCFEQRDSLKMAAVQTNDRVCAILDCQGPYRKIVFLIADKHVIRFFFFDASVSPGPFTSSPVLPFLNQDLSPSLGFTLFFRMCKTAPGKLYYPEPPICPVPNVTAYVLRLRREPKANVFLFKRPNGTEGVAKVYKPGNSLSLAAFYQEKNALEKFRANNAPVPTLLEEDPIRCYLLLAPYAMTLGEVNEYSRKILCAVAHAAAAFFRVARDLNFVHKDISPDNILVCQDQVNVLINDLGSCHETQRVTDTSGATLLYCCPFFGAHFELVPQQPYLYTLHNDMRALFISLFVFSIRPRTDGNYVVRKTLPWQRAGHNMQLFKKEFLTSKVWMNEVVPEAAQLLKGLWAEMFRKDADNEADFDLDKVLAILEDLGKEPGNSPIAK